MQRASHADAADHIDRTAHAFRHDLSGFLMSRQSILRAALIRCDGPIESRLHRST
jgi:hypothetical protein